MADFELFITLDNVITFVAIFGGIIIIALAKHWFDVSGYHFTRWTPLGQ